MTSNPQQSLPQDIYWGAVKTEDLPGTIRAKAEQYRRRIEERGYMDLYRRAERTYYGQDSEGGMSNSAAVTFGGENGENVMFRVNHPASLATTLLAIVLPKRLAYEPQTANADQESQDATVLAKSLLNHYTRSQELEEKRLDRARMAVVFASGFSAIRWNPHIGEQLTTELRPVFGDNGQPKYTYERDEMGVTRSVPVMEEWPVREGDLEVHNFSPIEVIHDLDSSSSTFQWCALPYRENVWDLAARYPEKRSELIAQRGNAQTRWPRTAWALDSWENVDSTQDPDVITVWWFYHQKTDALPNGRFSIVAGDVVVHDGDFTLAEVPLYELMFEQRMGSKQGHSRFWDILAMSDVYDSLSNTAHSSLDAFSGQTIIVPKASDVAIEDLGTNKLIKYSPVEGGGKPEALQLMAIPKELPEFMETVKREVETVMNINGVARGDVPTNLKSGAALALVQSLAVESNGQFQAAIVRSDEQLATGILTMLKTYASNKRLVQVVGTNKKAKMLAWSKDQLAVIDRVAVNIGTAMQNTEAGKLEIANQLVTQKLIDSPKKYLQVLRTGDLEEMEEDGDEFDLIGQENEDLVKGAPVIALLTDDHVEHVAGHIHLLTRADVRFNQQLVGSIMAHIKEHETLFTNMGPVLGVMTKQSVQPPPPAPAGPPPPPGGLSAAPGGPPPGGPPTGPALGAPPPEPGKALPLGQVPTNPQGLPSLPTNPLTGQRAVV